MRPPICSVGVDLGGTWVRLEAVDAEGRRLRSYKAPAPPLVQLPAFLKKRLRAWHARPRHLTVASRGVWTRPERAHLKRALRSLAQEVTVMSDVEAAWYAAFHSQAKKNPLGVVVISGTGSIALGRDAHGRTRRAGGWGPLLGDEGSAFWIGKTWLKRTHGQDASSHVLRLVRTPHHAVRRIAALAPRILRQAQQGNRTARGVVREAQSHLADLVVETARGIHIRGVVPVSWGGSVLDNDAFRSGFLQVLRRRGARAGLRIHVTPPGHNPALAITHWS